MKKIIISLIMLLSTVFVFAQIDKEQLSLDVSKADAANTEKLKAFIWKRHSTATVNGEVKATLVNELSFSEDDSLQVTQISAETSVKQKPGLRGRAQQSAAEDNMDYVGKALGIAIAYTYMSKGQLLDFFDKATVSEADGVITATGANVFLKGDKLTILLDTETKLFISKSFSSFLDKDVVTGQIDYALFSSGISHGAKTVVNLPAKNAVITAKNQDYTKRVQ